jgi:5-methylcytosine-specific restriction endonuclease McrA
MNPFSTLTNETLHQNLLTLARQERESSYEIIMHLMVVKARRLDGEMGYSGIFDYCTKALGFSRSTAYRRKTVMENAQKFPELLARLRDGRLHLCSAACIAPSLTTANATELMDAVAGMSQREVEALLLKRSKIESTLKLAVISLQILNPSAGTATPQHLLATSAQCPSPITALLPAPAFAAPPAPRTIIKPLTAQSSRVCITLTEATIDCLRRAKELVRCGSDDELLLRALQLFIAKNDPAARSARRAKRAAIKQAAKETQTKVTPATHNINGSDRSLSVTPGQPPRRGYQRDRDAAFIRAGGQCEYRSANGVRCESRRYLEVDHVDSVAFGGQSVVGNHKILCTTHHRMKTEETIGTRIRRKVDEANGAPRDAVSA